MPALRYLRANGEKLRLHRTQSIATEYIANFVLIVKNEVYRAGIRVEVLDFALHAHQLAAAFVFPPLPAHAEFAVFNPPLPEITAAAVITVLAVHRAVVFELQRRRVAERLLPLMKAVASSVESATPAASLCAHHGVFSHHHAQPLKHQA